MKIYYLRGALGNSDLLSEHKTDIDQLLKGDYQSRDLEKLRGHEIYSFRLSIEKRLLFSLEQINGQLYMVVLDYLPTHDYQKSAFLKSGVLHAYLSRYREAHKLLVEDIQFDTMCEIDLSGLHTESASQEGTHFEPVEYHQKHLFVLNPEQQQTTSLQLPGLCSGVAGSGKSALVFPMLFSYLSQRTEQQYPLLYVTKSNALVRMMQELFVSLPLGEQHQNDVHFKTVYDLIYEDNPDIELVDKADFIDWYTNYKSKEKNINKVQKQYMPDIEPECCYQEFRIASGLSSQEYLNLSEQQSSLPKPSANEPYSARSWVYRAFNTYCQSLDERRKINPDFYSFQKPAQYALVIVDESQDLSHQQLCELGRLTLNRNILFLMDSHQRLSDARSVRPFLLHHFHIQNPTELEITHRCPWRITQVANAVIAVKQQLAGGIADKHEPRCFIGAKDSDAGHTFLLNEKNLIDNDWIQSVVGQPYCAIVTRAEYIEEVRQVFTNSVLVFTPEQIKGLEYDVVVGYRLLNNDWCKQASQRFRAVSEKASPTHQAKRGEYVDSFVPELNQFNTAITRSSKVLILGLTQTHDNEFLYGRILPLSETTTPTLSCLDGKQKIIPWEEEVLKHHDRGNRELALLIWTKKLKGSEIELDEMIKKLRPPQQQLRVKEPQPTTSRPPVAMLDPEVLEKKSLPTSQTLTPKSNLVSKVSSSCHPSPSKNLSPQNFPSPIVSSGSHELSLEKKLVNNVISTFEQLNLATTTDEKSVAEKKIFIALSVYNSNELWITPHTEELYKYLNQPNYCKLFISFLVNHWEILGKMPYEKIFHQLNNDRKKFNLLYEDFKKLFSLIKNNKVFFNHIQNGYQLIHLLIAAFTKIADAQSYIEQLFMLGADLNIQSKDGTTAVIVAAKEDNPPALRILHRLGADINKARPDGKTPAYIAAELGHDSTLQLLYDLKADINQPNNTDISPAFIAAWRGKDSTVKLLYTLKANFNRTKSGITIASIAALEGVVWKN